MPDAEPIQSDPAGQDERAARSRPPGWGWVKAYVGIYALLLAVYILYCFTAYRRLDPPTAFINVAFPSARPQGGEGYAAIDPEDLAGAFDETTGHVRLWKELSFMSEDGRRFEIPPPARLTRREALAVAETILADARRIGEGGADIAAAELSAEERAERLQHLNDQRTIPPFAIYRSGWYVPWASVMTLYNFGGLVLLLVVFLRQPVRDYLDQNARETRDALARARAAQEEAEALKRRYEEMLQKLETEKQRLEETGKAELAEQRKRILASARHEAESMLESLRQSLDGEVAGAGAELRVVVAQEAVQLARSLLKEETTDADHAAAFDAFVKDVQETDLS